MGCDDNEIRLQANPADFNQVCPGNQLGVQVPPR